MSMCRDVDDEAVRVGENMIVMVGMGTDGVSWSKEEKEKTRDVDLLLWWSRLRCDTASGRVCAEEGRRRGKEGGETMRQTPSGTQATRGCWWYVRCV
jgi:hypothetical protein